jgi:hypothetical protein
MTDYNCKELGFPVTFDVKNFMGKFLDELLT